MGATIELKEVWPRWKKQTPKEKAKLTPKQKANKDVINLQDNEKEEEKALLNGLIMSEL